jgi:hypothetical protein
MELPLSFHTQKKSVRRKYCKILSSEFQQKQKLTILNFGPYRAKKYFQ